ncbi:MAG: glycosyltransferase family 2 protein [Thermaerobacter sp.]|nr:glycosyltransferase family 2 protein [Thermaerobacter sp.]
MLGGKRVFVVLPAYNAEKTLESVYRLLAKNTSLDEIILVDDASSDNTVGIARRLGMPVIVHERNLGYGGNQKTCYSEALRLGADVIVMLHPDLQYSPALVLAMAAMIVSGEYDLVLASRITGKSNAISAGMPFYKYIANRLLTYFENAMLNLKMSEYHSGYRAFSKELLSRVPYLRNSNDFVFDNQIIAQARLYGFRIGEISCPTHYGKESSSISCYRSLVYGLGVLRTACEYRLRAWNILFPAYLPRRLVPGEVEAAGNGKDGSPWMPG